MPMTAMDLVTEAKKRIQEIDTEEARQHLGDALVLDVREPAEYAAECLPNAINIPRGVLEFKIGSHPAFLGKMDAPIVVYCQTGGRSALATEALNKMGYENARSMAGGYNSWVENRGDVVQPS